MYIKDILYIKYTYLYIKTYIYYIEYIKIYIYYIYKITSKAIKFSCVYSHIIFNIYKIIYIYTLTQIHIYGKKVGVLS